MKDRRIVTYDLKAAGNYYDDATNLGKEIVQKAEDDLISGLMEFIEKEEIERIRTFEEYAMDFLFLGVLWDIYSGISARSSILSTDLLDSISRMREERRDIKNEIDGVKGPLSSLFLSSDPSVEYEPLPPSMKNLGYLIKWLSASGDFKYEVERFLIIESFLGKAGEKDAEMIISRSLEFGEWFKSRSLEVLGKYTENVDRFLTHVLKDHLMREDIIFCSRRRVEYHLNMACAEIMNGAFREDFLKRPVKAVLLPVCMRNPRRECMAESTPIGYACRGCSPECIVNKITEHLSGSDAIVLVLPHSADALKGDDDLFSQLGVVGVACPLNIVQGGWKARNLGIAAQCVVLNHCGCTNHWDSEGIVTDIDMNRLDRILNHG
jgi:hypothetical protein